MKINTRLLLVAFPLIFSTNTAIAAWEYVETSGTTFTNVGSGYLKDLDSSWQIPATRAKKSYNLTVDLSKASETNPLIQSEDSVPWDFTSVKTTTVKDQPESVCSVVDFTGCREKNISELIAPDCLKITNKCGFQDCKKLRKVYLPKCTYLGNMIFSGCDLLESVDIPLLESVHDQGNTFSGCVGLKRFEWNMPNMKMVPPSFFFGCSSLARVDVKTPVSEISGNAFKDIAPGAEIYMPAAVPETIGALAFANTKDCIDPDGPVQRIYLQDNYEDWLNAFKDEHHIIMLSNAKERAKFNEGWSEAVSDTVTRQRSHVIEQMKRDPDICRIDDNGTPKNTGDDKVEFRKKGLLAYAVRKHTGTVSYSYGCWIFKVPGKGFKVVVR